LTDDRTGRELTPRPTEPEGVVAPREPGLPETQTTVPERFYAGDQAHSVGLTEERAAQIVKQSSNARFVAFLAALFFVLFIPVYWLYAIGLPVIGVQGALEKEEEVQYVTDVRRGYALFLANCARCHGANGEGGVGPALNDQAKLFNAVTEGGLPGNGHLNPDYLHSVLREGGRYVCGDPNSVMPAWLEPKGPLNYREVEDIVEYIVATNDVKFSYVPAHAEAGQTLPPPVDVEGWRDPAYTPAPGSTPVPDCWRGDQGDGGTGGTPAPVESPGTVDSPRLVEIEGTGQVSWVDPETQEKVTSISVVAGETVTFNVINNSGLDHNFHIAGATELETAPRENDLPGTPTFKEGTQEVTYTFESDAELQFACTVEGHYPSMHGDFAYVSGGGSASPGVSPAASGEAPAPSAEAPAASAAP
jgi:mono/diheme cytochrome c family protein